MKSGAVQKYIRCIEEGQIFIVPDIDNNTSYNSLKVQLSVACSKGQIIRIMRGIYYKPKFSKFLDMYVPYNINDVAYAIARLNGWNIIPSGNACANLIGLSTQMSVKYIFYSNGPYKTYTIDGIQIDFKHRTPKDMPQSRDLAILIQGIKSKGKDNLSYSDIHKISNYIVKNNIKIKDDEIRGITAWVKGIIVEAAHLKAY